MDKQNYIVYNAIRTPDGTLLESHNRHDYVVHIDKNGEEYMNDGGNSYFRRSVNKEGYKDLTVYSDSPHKDIREVITWGSYGIKGDQPIKYLKLKDMETPHIEAILETQPIEDWRKDIFEDELEYRKVTNYVG